jgi:hypothetical protein
MDQFIYFFIILLVTIVKFGNVNALIRNHQINILVQGKIRPQTTNLIGTSMLGYKV